LTGQLWDLEEGGPTSADEYGVNYNPVVLDDSVSREGYPALNGGWGGCAGTGGKGLKGNLVNQYACSHPK